MAVTWDWKNKIGKIKITDDLERTFWVNMYDGGNCPLVMLGEFKDEKGVNCWTMWNFFVDTGHMKRCFGLTKNKEGHKNNIFKDWKFEMTIKRKAQYFDLIIECISQCKNAIIKIKE